MTAFPTGAENYESFRTWVWSSALPVAGEGKESSETEMEVQARWFGGEFGRTFTGTDGEAIKVVQFGHWNRGAGPDFTECAVEINGERKTGAIEIDLDSRDWEGHGHGENPGFNEVVLHVFTDGPSLNRTYTRNSDHRQVTQLQLPQYTWAQGPPDFLPEAFPGRCVAPLAGMSDGEVKSLLESAAQYRVQAKTNRLEMMSNARDNDQALFQAIAEALGFRYNKTAMAVLSQRCPIRELKQLDAIDREARLFGAAGFLDQEIYDETAEPEARTYLRGLWDRWWKIRDKVEAAPARAIRWQLSGSRPFNHPQRRVAALAEISGRWEEFSTLWRSNVNNLEKDVNNLAKTLSHPFWDRHYTVRAKPAPKAMKLIGKDRVRDILGNVLFPYFMGVAEDQWRRFACLGGVDSNQKLKRASLRLFGNDEARQKLFTSYYHQQQGLLQIYSDFCLKDASECEQCPFPEQLVQWQTSMSTVGN